MKIYKIKANVNKCQLVLPVSDDDEVYDMISFDGTSKKHIWKELDFYIDNPLQKQGDFFSVMNSSALVCNQRAVHELGYFWDLCAEILPIRMEDGTQLFMINVVDCVNALDNSRAMYEYYDAGKRSNRIIKYAFHKNRLHTSSVFKIPETAKSDILTYTGIKSPEDEFFTAYANSGLSGLDFILLYDSDAG